MKKAVFFDADGTIMDIQKGLAQDIPRAIERLHANGHRAFLCTGRSRAFVPPYIEELGLDGIIAGISTYIELGGKCLFNREIPQETALRSVRVLRENGLIPLLEGTEYMYYDTNEYNVQVDWFADLITAQLAGKRRPITGNEGELHFGKISAKRRPGCSAQRACELLAGDYDFIWHGGGFAGGTIEMVPKGFSKATGISALCRELNISLHDTVAFGDSSNDLAMLEAAGFSVAMGNASAELAARADYRTAPWDQGGVTQALEHLSLI